MGFDQTIEIEQNGYLYIWLSSESKEARVWFDDLTITHEEHFVVQATDYGVWGDVIREQKSDIASYRYGYQGQFAEKDEETGWNHFELREYDPIIGRTITTDPARQFYSPYMWVGNNPISGTDPTGGFSPIYDLDGNFLGTDDQGLKGEAIFMHASQFTQGMSHESALAAGFTFDQMHFFDINLGALADAMPHYDALPNRPDYDGYLTLDEANRWWREGNGEPLYVDASQIYLMNVSVSSFDGKPSMYKNFATPAAFMRKDPNTGLVYGTIKLTLLDPNIGTVRLGGANGYLDSYDFKYDDRFWRNVATAVGSYWARKDLPAGQKRGVDYKIYNYGIGRVSK